LKWVLDHQPLTLTVVFATLGLTVSRPYLDRRRG
jgi:hypothetical protein